MAKKKLSISELEEFYQAQKQITEQQNKLLEEQLNDLNIIFDSKKRIAIQDEISANNQRLAFEMQEAYNKASREGYILTKETQDAFNEELKAQKDLIKGQKSVVENNKKILVLQEKISKTVKLGWGYLMDSDKVIKQTILDLGMSGAKAEQMRLSFEQSAMAVARLGGNIADIRTIMTTFADETGRARALTAEMITDINVMGRGTAIGVENASRLAAQFELMGVDVRESMNYVQGVVESSELMGVNTANVLKTISANFKDLQSFTFSQGVQGFAEMAQYAEKFRIDVDQALASAEATRRLEGAVDLAAQLQVLGGEFAKTDPFQMLFLARNDPAAYQRKINEMTASVVTFRKTSEGTFEKFLSPADRDRLFAAAEALGMQGNELVEQAMRMSEIQRMRQQMIGMGLTPREKDLIEGMATFVSETGRFQVQVAGTAKDVAELTAQDLKVLKQTSSTLEERAKAAQTFDDVYRATIEEFKTILLPMLRGVNSVLENVRPVINDLTDWVGQFMEGKNDWLKIAGMLILGASAWKGVGLMLGGISEKLKGAITARFNKGGGLNAAQTLAKGKAAGARAASRGAGIMKGGLGVGAAGLGIGGGIALAAEGISSLADAMSKLDKDQAETLKSIVTTLAISLPAAGIGLVVFGKMAEASALGVGIITGAILGVGAAIGIAAAGIGFMGQGLAKLVESSKGAGPAMGQVAAGVAGLSASLVGMQFGIGGALTLNSVLKNIAKRSDDLEDVGDAFDSINTVLSGSKDDFLDVERAITNISNANLNNLKPLAQLKNIFNKPLKVEFSDKEVAVVSNITFNVDGYKFIEKINGAAQITSNQVELRRGKAGARPIS